METWFYKNSNREKESEKVAKVQSMFEHIIATIELFSISIQFIYIAPNYNNCHLKALK